MRGEELNEISRHSARQYASRQRGSIMPMMIGGMFLVMVMMALAMDQGLLFAARTAIQNTTDAAARAAIITLSRESVDKGNTTAAAQTAKATAASYLVGPGIQGGIKSGDINVEFGAYDFKTGAFTPTNDQNAKAVRVTVRRGRGTESGPYRSVLSSVGGLETGAVSIAALRCRNVVFLQDASYSFRDDIGQAEQALVKALDTIDDDRSTLDRVGLVAVSDRVLDGATTSTMLNPATQTMDLKNKIDQLDKVVCRDGAICGGTDLAAGLQRADQILRTGNAACENLVVMISDGVPCDFQLFPLRIQVKFKETAAVARDIQTRTNIAAIKLNSKTGRGEQGCSLGLGSNLENEDFLRDDIVSGFGRLFESDLQAAPLAKQIDLSLSLIPPVLVD